MIHSSLEYLFVPAKPTPIANLAAVLRGRLAREPKEVTQPRLSEAGFYGEVRSRSGEYTQGETSLHWDLKCLHRGEDLHRYLQSTYSCVFATIADS